MVIAHDNCYDSWIILQSNIKKTETNIMQSKYLTLVNGFVAQESTLTEYIIKAVTATSPHLIVLSGTAGAGKSHTSRAVRKKLFDDRVLKLDGIFDLSSQRVGALQDSIDYAATFQDNHNKDGSLKSFKVVFWDEIRGVDAERAAIEDLIKKGYSVVAVSRESGVFNTTYKKTLPFKMTEFNLGLQIIDVNNPAFFALSIQDLVGMTRNEILALRSKGVSSELSIIDNTCYKIKSLAWDYVVINGVGTHRESTSDGNYTIKDVSKSNNEQSYKVSYHFSEYDDESSRYEHSKFFDEKYQSLLFSSVLEAKKFCKRDWLMRMTQFLEAC